MPTRTQGGGTGGFQSCRRSGYWRLPRKAVTGGSNSDSEVNYCACKPVGPLGADRRGRQGRPSLQRGRGFTPSDPQNALALLLSR